MEIIERLIIHIPPLSLQEEFTGVVARALCRACRDIEGLRGRMAETTRQVESLLEGLLSQSFSSWMEADA